ncbi:MAG: DNA/RNA nuclease SfsA [Candidatus Nezhaarchaeota archaeon]|nr:DNA/RNA nuclease SfsA [Candidatus Nezhaarchaeota archaeon]
MELPGPLIKARFLRREGRFKGYAEVGGEVVSVHIHDPGRLPELLRPGVGVWVRAHSRSGLRTKFYLTLVDEGGCRVLVDSSLHVKIVEEGLELGRVVELRGYRVVKKEAVFSGKRIDFLVQSPGERPGLLEVKGCTLVREGVALFPDSPTARGLQHVKALVRALREGLEAYVLFLVPHCRALEFRPNFKVDPEFSRALVEAAEEGVGVVAYKAEAREASVELTTPLPVKLEPLHPY